MPCRTWPRGTSAWGLSGFGARPGACVLGAAELHTGLRFRLRGTGRALCLVSGGERGDGDCPP